MRTTDAHLDDDCDLDAVDATVELTRRPARPPDHAGENRALVALAQQVGTSPKDVLQKLAEMALELCRADSAGVSVLEKDEGRPLFRWHALAGLLAHGAWDAVPEDASPCGAVLARNAPMLFAHPARHFQALAEITPPILEALVVPFVLGGERVGTVWVAAHAPGAGFDAEDVRLLGSLTELASVAHRATTSLDAAREAQCESQQLEATLRQRELQFRRLLDALPVGAYTCDAEGLITYHNEQAVRLWGRTPKLRHPNDRYCGSFKLFSSDGAPLRHDQCWMALAIHGDQPYHAEEIVIERPDGSRVAALAHASPIRDEAGALLGAVNILVDISGRKKAEQALKESEQRFSRFMDRLPGLAWIKSLDGRYVFVNDAAGRAFRKTRAELYGKSDAEIFPPPTATQFRANDLQALASGSGVEAIETLEHEDGVHHSLVSKFPIPGARGEPALLGGIAIDITERIRAEEALRRSEQIYRAIGESIDYGVWVCDPEGRNVYASESFLKLVGLTQEQCSNLG